MPRALFWVLVLVTSSTTWGCSEGSEWDSQSLKLGDAGLSVPLRLSFDSEFKDAFGKIPEGKQRIARDPQVDALDQILVLLRKDLIHRRQDNVDARVRAVAHAVANYLNQTGKVAVYRDKEGFWRLGNERDQATESGLRKSFVEREETHDDAAGLETVAKDLPAEFALYLTSLTDNREMALGQVGRLLALPDSERPNLSAIAHYRRARLVTLTTKWEELEDEVAKDRLHLIRGEYTAAMAAVEAGAPDIAGTREASRGWMAHARSLILRPDRLEKIGEADFAYAAKVYIEAYQSGDAGGQLSAIWLARELVASGMSLGTCAADSRLRQLITMYLSAGGERWLDNESAVARPSLVESWLYDIAYIPAENSGDAVRIASLLYSTGKYSACEKALCQVSEDDPVGALLRSRIALRKGKRTEAAGTLRRVAAKMDESFDRACWGVCPIYTRNFDHIHIDRGDDNSAKAKVRAELAMLLLAEGEHAYPFHLNAMAGIYEDNWYLAECVLSTAELSELIGRNWTETITVKKEYYEPIDLTAEVRGLLGRRLCRAGEWAEGAKYLAEPEAAAAREMDKLAAAAADTHLEPRARADAYWREAVIISRYGYELLYTHFGESWSITTTPNWTMSEWPACRIGRNADTPWCYLAPPTAEEVKRVESWLLLNASPPNRGHRVMKYEALRLGLKAVELLPDNDPSGGMILQCIGSQLMYLDPPAANQAYKVLATRFKETPFGKHAAAKHWFMRLDPPLEPDPEWVKNPPANYTPPAPKPKEEDASGVESGK